MGDLEEKLDRILNDPQAMSQIMSLAQALGASSPLPDAQPTPQPPSATDGGFQLDPRLLTGIASLLSQYNQAGDQKVALLLALKPFLKEQRHAKLEQAIQITKISRIARMALDLFRAEEDDHV